MNMNVLMKLLLSIFMLAAASGSAAIEDLLKEHALSRECILELEYGNYTNGAIFDVSHWMHKPPFEKKEYPLGSYEDMEQWMEERRLDSLNSWKYLGAWKGYHLLYIELHGDTWRSTSVLSLKVTDKGITEISRIEGCKNSDIHPKALQGNVLTYDQTACVYEVFFHTAKVYPELHTLFPEGIPGSGMFTGGFIKQCALDSQGRFGPETLLEFYPCEGMPPYSGKRYQPCELKEFVIDLAGEYI